MEVTTKDLAQFFGVNVRTIQKWMADGCPIKKPGQKGGQTHIFETEDVIAWRIRERINAEIGNVDLMSTEEAKRKKLAAEAGLAELELAKKQGIVVELTEVERDLSNKFANFRAVVRRVPERVVMQLLGLTDETKIKEIILEELDLALETLSDDSGEE